MPLAKPLKLVSATHPSSEPLLVDLNDRMARYYNAPERAQYYARLNEENETWHDKPFHLLIRDQAHEGMSVLDLGCGSGTAFQQLRDHGVRYTGIDWSAEQIEQNRRRFAGQANFLSASLYQTGLPDDSFDLVISLFVLEHLVWPHRFLREIVRVTRPGGRVAILCPHFRSDNRIPSLHYGREPMPVSQRIRSGHLLQAARHLALRNWIYPWLIGRFARDAHPFLINLDPSCLHGDYYPDNDAVYLTDRDEVVCELRSAGAIDMTRELMTSARLFCKIDEHGLLVIAQKNR